MRPLLTPALEHELVVELSWGDRTLTDIAARTGLKNIESLRSWLSLGAAGDERYVRLAEAVVAGQRRVAARDAAVARHAAALVDAGATLRAAAKALAIPWGRLRVILDHARAGEAGLEPLAWAAERRARAPRSTTRFPVVVSQPLTAARCV